MAFPPTDDENRCWLPECLGLGDSGSGKDQFPELINWCTRKVHESRPVTCGGQDLPKVRNLVEYLRSQRVAEGFLLDVRDRTMGEVIKRLQIILDVYQDAKDEDQIAHQQVLRAVLDWRRLVYRAHEELTKLIEELNTGSSSSSSSTEAGRGRPGWTINEAAVEAMRFRIAALGLLAGYWKVIVRVLCKRICDLLHHTVQEGWYVVHEQIHSWRDPRVAARDGYEH